MVYVSLPTLFLNISIWSCYNFRTFVFVIFVGSHRIVWMQNFYSYKYNIYFILILSQSHSSKQNWKRKTNALRERTFLLLHSFGGLILCNGYVMVILGNLQNKHFCFVQKIGIIGNCGYLVLLLDWITDGKLNNWRHARNVDITYPKQKYTEYVISLIIRKE